MPGQRKSMTGKVVSDKMDKTVVVVVESTTRHRLYHKILRRTKRYLAHDDRLDAKPGDLVRILETRPLSRNKRWRVTEILRRGEVAEIAPREIDSEYLGTKREKKVAAPEAAAVTTDTAPEAKTAPVADTTASAEEAASQDTPADGASAASRNADAATTDTAPEAAAASTDSAATADIAPDADAAPVDDDTPPAALPEANAASTEASEESEEKDGS